MRWHVVIEATARNTAEAVMASAPAGSRFTIFAERGLLLRLGRTIKNQPVNYVDSVLNAMATVRQEQDELLLHVPAWASVDSSVFVEAEALQNFAAFIFSVVDKSGVRQRVRGWKTMGTCVFGTGKSVHYARKAFVATNSVFAEISKAYKFEDMGPKEDDVSIVDDEMPIANDLLMPGQFVDLALLHLTGVDLKEKPHLTGEYVLGSQAENEVVIREAKAHWIAVQTGTGIWTWDSLLVATCGRNDRDLLVFPGMILANPGSVRRMPPLVNPASWKDDVIAAGFRVSVFDASGTSIAEHGIQKQMVKSSRKLKVAVMSMCGVTSFEDRYGLGGEHQVVHWLKEGFDAHPDVECCDIFDTMNHTMAPEDYYDLVLSNSCWCRPPKIKKGGTSIFWHFNTNAFRGNEETIKGMGYTHVWTNSPTAMINMQRMGLNVSFKHLNASTLHHSPYRWKSEMFCHDACYIGGYQTEYKGKGLIDSYIKVLCGKEFDFAIYGNRKWKASVQKEALKTDRLFKPEHYDESFEPHYKHVLHPDDFPILAKNCKIWVNFNAEDQRPLGMVNDRPIWGMACGAFFITDDTAEQRALYGDTCDYSVGGEHLVDRVRYWLSRDKERMEMAQAAHENIMRRGLHTHSTVEAAIRQHLEDKGPQDER